MRRLRIATRGSDLALTQTRQVAARIEKALDCETELVVVRTTGDRIQDRSLAKIGGKGLFLKELEEALLAGTADLAVHSAKDVPAGLAPGCVLAAFPERADPRDALLARERGATLDALPKGARVGTGSTRRVALLRARRPDLELLPLRGNVPTRLARLEAGDFDALVLACAGVDRLGLGERIDERIAPESLLPAVGQGLLALETRADDEALVRSLGVLEDAATGRVARAERAFQAELGGDCSIPLAGFAECDGRGGLRFRGLVSSLDGRTIARAEATGPESEAPGLGRSVAKAVLDDGGREILRAIAAGSATGV